MCTYHRFADAYLDIVTRKNSDWNTLSNSLTYTHVRVVVVVVEILFRIADQTGRFAQYYDGDIIREVNSKEMKCLVHVVYHQ